MKLILCLSLGLLALLPVPGMDHPYGSSLCVENAVCSNKGTCTCDTLKGFEAGNTCDASCSCPANHHIRSIDGKCAKNLGQTCSASSECGDNSVCDTTCKCDQSKSFLPASAGDTFCKCDSSRAKDLVDFSPCLNNISGAEVCWVIQCLLRAGQNCTDSSECFPSPGMICSSGTCGCDTSKNYKDATPGDFFCECADNYGYKRDGTCGKQEGQACTADDTCVDHATCTFGICTCDASSSSSDGGLCGCTAATHALKSDNTCGKKIGQDCSNSSECIDTAACIEGKCKCDATLNRDVTTADGATSCPCAGNHKEEDGTCTLKLGQACNASSAACMHGTVCDDKTSICVCDTANNYKAGTAGDDCACADYAAPRTINGKKYCGIKVGGDCKASTNDQSCDSGSAGLFVSLTVLVTGLLMTLIPI